MLTAMFAQVFHASALVHHLLAMVYMYTNLDFSGAKHEYVLNMDRYFWRFFTGWNFTLQAAYLVLCVVEDVFRWKGSRIPPTLSRTKNYAFGAFVFPFTLFVSSMFWVVFHWDRSQVYPEEVDEYVPFCVNHAVHTTVAVVALIEFLLGPHPSRGAIYGNITGFMIYLVVMWWTLLVDGHWIYPLYATMETMPWQIILCISGTLMEFGVCGLGRWLDGVYWGKKGIDQHKDRHVQQNGFEKGLAVKANGKAHLNGIANGQKKLS